jgi:CrcB protein
MLGKDPRELLAVFVGGAVGTVARAYVGTQLLPTRAGDWPWGTLLVNMVAAFVLGYVVTRLERLPAPAYARPLLGTGLCGGLSTFSTMQVEVVRFAQDGSWAMAVGYVVVSIVGGLAMLHLATRVARIESPR